jgi:hypothetical protein
MKWIVILLSTVLCACAQQATVEMGQRFSIDGAKNIRVGKSDKGDVERALGSNYSRAVGANGEEVWTYQNSTTTGSPSASSYIPLVGTFVGHTDTTSVSQSVEVAFRGKIVSRCWVTTTTTNGSIGGTVGVHDDSQVSHSDCGT